MKRSLRQLLRTPGKAALFFLLMLATALMLTVGTVTTVEANQRIGAAEAQYHTIAVAEQKPLQVNTVMEMDAHQQEVYPTEEWVYGEPFDLTKLDFAGADYIHPPENRPYLLARLEGMKKSVYVSCMAIAEIEALTDIDGSQSINEVAVRRILRDDAGIGDPDFREGAHIFITVEASTAEKVPLRRGHRYIVALFNRGSAEKCSIHDVYEENFSSHGMPYTTQRDESGQPVTDGLLPFGTGQPMEVTEGFYESEDYALLQRWMEVQEYTGEYFPILPTNSLELLPSFHTGKAAVTQGRAITQEEFDTGAPVVMVSQEFIIANHLNVGDTLRLPISMAAYGFPKGGGEAVIEFQFGGAYSLFDFSPMNAQGEVYAPYADRDYEIVGVYSAPVDSNLVYNENRTLDVGGCILIIPAASVSDSDVENIVYIGPLDRVGTSFELKNGTIAAFDSALHAAVPEADQLEITYDDGGYSEIIGKLRTARTAAVLLLAVGITSALAVVLLALYFFVVKQKRRTAIERSLGMTKRQCRVSILAGLMVLTFLAVVLGTVLGGVVLHMDSFTAGEETTMEEAPDVPMLGSYRTDYSLWAMVPTQELDESGVGAPFAVYILIPIELCGGTLGLALWLVGRNLKIEPILLLSGRGE